MKLGVDSYSLRWQDWDAFQLLRYAAGLRLDTVHFSERRFFPTYDAGHLREVRAEAERLGLTLELGMGCIDYQSRMFEAQYGTGEQQLRDTLNAAAVLGSPMARCFIGIGADRLDETPIGSHVAEAMRVLREVRPVALDLGIKTAVENHGGIDLLARELRQLVESVGPEFVGVCLDTGNPAAAGEDPMLSTEVLSPYVLTTHFRDTLIWETSEGCLAQWVPLGQGCIDFGPIVACLESTAPGISIDLEIVTGREPYRIDWRQPESDYWRAYPEMPARDFARFLRLVRPANAGPYRQVLAPGLGRTLPDGEAGERLRSQQVMHFEASVRWSQDQLGLGEAVATD